MKDSAAFERFFKDNYAPLYAYAIRLTGDEEAGRDIVADAFEHAWANFKDEQVNDWHAYIYGYVRHKCADLVRHTLVKEKYVEFYMQCHDEIEEEADTEERLSAIRSALDDLSPRTRLVLQECYMQKKKYKEVAEELDISINAVKQHIVKALQSIRKKVKKQT